MSNLESNIFVSAGTRVTILTINIQISCVLSDPQNAARTVGCFDLYEHYPRIALFISLFEIIERFVAFARRVMNQDEVIRRNPSGF